jgi:hypothetical protein
MVKTQLTHGGKGLPFPMLNSTLFEYVLLIIFISYFVVIFENEVTAQELLLIQQLNLSLEIQLPSAINYFYINLDRN